MKKFSSFGRSVISGVMFTCSRPDLGRDRDVRLRVVSWEEKRRRENTREKEGGRKREKTTVDTSWRHAHTTRFTGNVIPSQTLDSYMRRSIKNRERWGSCGLGDGVGSWTHGEKKKERKEDVLLQVVFSQPTTRDGEPPNSYFANERDKDRENVNRDALHFVTRRSSQCIPYRVYTCECF